VLYQLSYAPGPGDCIGGFRASPEAMTDLPMEEMDETQREREAEADAELEGPQEERDGDDAERDPDE
jgi:hypothetical protein